MLPLARLAAGTPRVFPSHPRAEGYFPSAVAEEARLRLVRCLERGEGPALLIGSPGVGKSSLLAVLREQLRRKFHVASLTSAQLCTRRALLQSILFSLGQPYRHREEGELRIALVDYLTQDPESKNGTVLLVDEAQALPQRLLEELRALGNLAPQGEASVRLLLAGGPALEELFAAPENEAFNQRISTRCYLSPMSHADTVQYVRAHLAAAGGDADTLITPDALDAVYQATDGIARLVNQLCDRALLLAADAGYDRLERAAIETAWADLQQLPTPWNLPPVGTDFADTGSSESSVVEFGPLSDDSDDNHDNLQVASATMLRMADCDAEDSPAEQACDSHVVRVASVATQSHDLDDDELELELMPLDDMAVANELTVAAEVSAEQSVAVASSAVVPSVERSPARQTSPPVRRPLKAERPVADDVFGSDFDDEELVLDSFASMQSIVSASAPRVSNTRDQGATSQLLAAIDSECQVHDTLAATVGAAATGPSLGVYDRDDLADDSADDSEAATEHCGGDCLHPCQVDSICAGSTTTTAPKLATNFDGQGADSTPADDLDLLVVDDEDLPLGVAAVERRDYRQLFTSLRRG
jgi:type II secretory pathway predicted ATPase ExeA